MSLSEVTQASIELVLTGEQFNRDEISKQLCLNPTVTYQKGDQIKNFPIYRQETCWAYELKKQSTDDIRKECDSFLNIFEPKKEILLSLAHSMQLEIIVHLAIFIIGNQTPYLGISQHMVRFLHDINASIDFPYYLYDSE